MALALRIIWMVLLTIGVGLLSLNYHLTALCLILPCLAYGIWAASRQGERALSDRRSEWWETGLCIALIAAGAGLRFYRIGSFPSDLTAFSSRYALLLQQILHGVHYFPRGPAWVEGDETMLLYLALPFARILGSGCKTMRIIGAAYSLLLIPAVYYAALKFYSPRVARVAAALTACSGWFVGSAHDFHRARYDLGAAAGLASLGLLVGTGPKQLVKALAAGLLTGLGFYLQASNGLFMVACFILLAVKMLARSPRSVTNFGIYSATAGLVVIHSIAVLIRHPEISERKASHFMLPRNPFANDHEPAESSSSPSGAWLLEPPLRTQEATSKQERVALNFLSLMSELLYDQSSQPLEPLPRPFVTPVIAAFFVAGLAACRWKHLKQPAGIPVLLLALWWLTLAFMRLYQRSLYADLGVACVLMIAALGLVQVATDRRFSRLQQNLFLILALMGTGCSELLREKMTIDHQSGKVSGLLGLQTDLTALETGAVVAVDFPEPRKGRLEPAQQYALIADPGALFVRLTDAEMIERVTGRPLHFEDSSQAVTSFIAGGNSRLALKSLLEHRQLWSECLLPHSQLWKLDYLVSRESPAP